MENIKCVVIGDGSTGKTSMYTSYNNVEKDDGSTVKTCMYTSYNNVEKDNVVKEVYLDFFETYDCYGGYDKNYYEYNNRIDIIKKYGIDFIWKISYELYYLACKDIDDKCVEMVKYLFDNDFFEKNILNKDECYILWKACEYKNWKIVEYLVRKKIYN